MFKKIKLKFLHANKYIYVYESSSIILKSQSSKVWQPWLKSVSD